MDTSNSRIENQLGHGYVNVIGPNIHKGRLTGDALEIYTNNFSKPALFKQLVEVGPSMMTRPFYEQIDATETLQWRVKVSDMPATMRSMDGASDYNYVTGKVGTGAEFLDDIFERKLDVYSHLGTISAGYNDPYKWGKEAFQLVRKEIFRGRWFDVPGWKVTGHMFLGNSNQDYGEPRFGAVGSDWHMFPTLNIFVMVAGKKKWWTRPPKIGDQLCDYNMMFQVSSGREAPGHDFASDLMIIEPGDVLLNPPFEWHKVLNARGFTLGAAFRVIDVDYLSRLSARKNLNLRMASNSDDLAHFITSASYASRDLCRAQMLLNDIEYSYLTKPNARVVETRQ